MTNSRCKLPRAFVAVIVLAITAACCAAIYRWSRPNVPFDSLVWQQDRQARAKMLPDLMRSKLHKGMTRAAVEDLLGRPDRWHDRTEVYKPPAGARTFIRYEVVPAEGHYIAELTIILDDAGRLMSFDVHED